MHESSARRPVSRRALPCLAVVLALLVVATGCSQKDPKAAAPAAPTPMANLNTTAMEVPRIEFCSLVPDRAVRDALAGKPDSDASYGNGDETTLPGIGKEVVHEIGCAWGTEAGASARAWVFARPVDAAFARTVIASSRRTDGCRLTPGPAYGDPSLTQTCRLPDGSRRVRHAGLFGQTWLTCEVGTIDPAASVTDVGDRSQRWCVQVANALNTAR
jgi:hypothetical protein